ncbi:hypothetical protein C5167_046493 [Papaver somniferum]|uniref:Uncharacterized protein n=1 Tax=Papaver somniferum TaxID=3469 RepID=A0A4Y7LGD5_PAPSO|nr:hypothetical protein C5167_046493 [Papaver somniferum]
MHYGASISMLCVVNARKRHPEGVKSGHILNSSTYQAITLESTEVFVAPGFDGLAEKNGGCCRFVREPIYHPHAC